MYMASKPQYDHAANGKTIVPIYMSSKLLEVIDEKRGDISRSKYISNLIVKTLKVKLDE